MNRIVSIIVPLYNYAHYLSDLVDSVVSQEHKEWEMIIVDDNSKDDPLSMLKKYPEFTGGKILYHRLHKNFGYSKAKNEGIIRSKGEYIVVIDADDMLFSPHSISLRVKCCRDSQGKWVHAKAYEFSDRKPYKIKWKRRKFIKRFEQMNKSGDFKKIYECIHSQTVMVNRSVYEKVGLYEESMRSMSDKEMWARIYHSFGKPAYINEFVALYRIHRNQMHKSSDKIKKLPALKKRLETLIKKRKAGDFSGVRVLEP